jgi:type II secretory pathway pseudopilin PulG
MASPVNTWKSTLIAAIVMGLLAAALVWWLERFSTDRLVSEMQRYLRRQDEFNDLYPPEGDAV